MRRLLSRIQRRKAPSLDEDDRVLQLFRNRAELKKARAELQEEILRLKDSLEQQQGATAHVQAQLERLEARLVDSVSGHHTLVYYHLRDLWKAGADAIGSLVAELSAQQEERERRSFLAESNGQQFGLRESAEKAFNRAQDAALEARASLLALQQARAAAAPWWLYFRRRELDRQLLVRTEQVEHSTQALEAARRAREVLSAQESAEFPGLSVLARRSINLAAIVYAEILLMPLLRTPLQGLLAEAMRRREPPSSYGDPPACEELMAQVARLKTALPSMAAVAVELRQRTELLFAQAAFDFPDDVVPAVESVSATALRDDYWGLRRLLLS